MNDKHPERPARRSADEHGIALIAVLLALAVLLAMAGPFVLSMGRGDQAARAALDEVHVDWGSASARDVLLQQAAQGSYSYDLTPAADGRDEYPNSLELPESLQDVGSVGFGNTLLQGEVEDLSRRVDLDTATPLTLANLLGLSLRTTEEVESGGSEIPVDGSTEGFPVPGYLLIGREVIRYEDATGTAFTGLTRGAFAELGFLPASVLRDYIIAADSLVLDFRCVLAVLHPHTVDGNPGTRKPYGSVREIRGYEAFGFPGFTDDEMGILERYCAVGMLRENSARWGRAERVFEILDDAVVAAPRILMVRSAAGMGAGRIVRIRSLDGRQQEYALVADTVNLGNRGAINLTNKEFISLMQPLQLQFDPIDTVVEPLVGVPVNVNTADPRVLTALFANLRAQTNGAVRDGQTVDRPPYLSPRRAADLAEQLRLLRGDVDALPMEDAGAYNDEGAGGIDLTPRPFEGWEDFAGRFVPLLAARTESRAQRDLIRRIYGVLQVGCADNVDMGTAPICFHSSPLVAYRASAVRLMASGVEAARMERSGTALALPGEALIWGAATQEMIEEFVRIDRHSPWWQTGPINTSAILPNRAGTVPAMRTEAHLLATLFPDFGFGRARFPDKSGNDGWLRPQPSSTPFGYPDNVYQHDAFSFAWHPEGRALDQEGVYRILNTGERGTPGAQPSANRDHSRIAFPLTTVGGLTARHATSFWFRLDDTGPQVLYDLSDPNAAFPDRNRIRLEIREASLFFEVMAEAGVDPQPSQSTTAVQRSVGTWKLALSDFNLQPQLWYHASISAHGDRPGQMSLHIDGVPRLEPELKTYLSSAIPVYQPDTGAATFLLDRERYRPIQVESTQGFPQQGVLRVGLELFEYSRKDDSTFYCAYDSSMGGRSARMFFNEWNVGIPTDANRDQLQELRDLLDPTSPAVAPDHPVGTGVELYGYSVPVYPQSTLQLGGAQLADSLGAFAGARVANNADARPINVTAGQVSRNLGRGIDNSWTGNLELADPVSALNFPPPPASDQILSAFPASGGYAMIVQRRMPFRTRDPRGGAGGGQIGSWVYVGGVEVIRYAARTGTQLTGVQRNVTLPVNIPDDTDGNFDFTQPKIFVTDWSPEFDRQGVSANSLPLHYPYVVPISIPVSGLVNADSDYVQWVQVRPNGTDDAETEWVRYNAVLDSRHLTRIDSRAFRAAVGVVTLGNPSRGITVPDDLGGANPIFDQQTEPWGAPFNDGVRRIGYVDPVEVQFPFAHAMRVALKFRGDDFADFLEMGRGIRQGISAPLGKTSSHAQPAGTPVLPVQRFEYDRGAYGLSAPRPGRLDRIALVQGSRRQSGQTPGVEWHTVNWAVGIPRSDNIDPDDTTGNSGNEGRELIGQWPFYLVAFQDQVTMPLIGEAAPSRSDANLTDVRLLDRMVKFPSGELPAVDADNAFVGGSAANDGVPMRGLIDEVAVMARMAFPRPLDQQLNESANEFYVRPNVIMTPAGLMEGGRPRQLRSYGNFDQFAATGGMLQIDEELIAYQNYDVSTGRVSVAQNGRGMLGTLPRGHDEGAVVHFLEQTPTAILSAGLSQNDHEVQVNDLGGLPGAEGTVLVGQELLHYTFTRGRTTLAMPRWHDPENEGRARVGLFRGRFGTVPGSLTGGSPVVWMPFRYWDRFHERAEDPALAHVQLTLDHGPAWFASFGWEENAPEATVDLQCMVRLDERARFDEDPEQNPWLWRFDDGQPGGQQNRIQAHGRRFEARFQHVYSPGAFSAQTWMAQGWKQAPTIRTYLLDYEGETRILQEEVTTR